MIPKAVRRSLKATLISCALLLASCSQDRHETAASGVGKPTSSTAAKFLAGLPPGYQQSNIDNGRVHFSLCRSCHTAIAGGADLTGPNLYGVFDRKVASRAAYAYSPALASGKWIWDAAHLDAWLKDPSTFAPGTKMTFLGLKDDVDRRDVIAYLKVVSSGGPP